MNSRFAPSTKRVKDVGWSFVGITSPLALAVLSVPVLLHRLGPSDFGIVTLVWVLVGYSSFLDLGMSRALTQSIAARRGASSEAPVGGLILLGFVALLGLGLLFGLVLLAASDALTGALHIPSTHHYAVAQAFRLSAWAAPAVTVGAGVRSVFESDGRFAASSATRFAVGVSTTLAPAIAAALGATLDVCVIVIVGARWATTIGSLAAIRADLGEALARRIAIVSDTRALFETGAWMTISNLVAPLLTYSDRFIIGFMASASAVAFYATPYDIVTRVWIIPTAISTVAFPTFGTNAHTGDHAFVRDFWWFMNLTAVVTLPVVLLIEIAAYPGLTLWLGRDFAERTHVVAEVLAVGVFFNSIGFIALSALQGAGRADVAARLHLWETLGYLPLLLLAARFGGIVAVATVWTARVGVDFLLQCRAVSKRTSITGLGKFIIHWVLPSGGALLLVEVLPWRPAKVVVGAAVFAALVLGMRTRSLSDTAPKAPGVRSAT